MKKKLLFFVILVCTGMPASAQSNIIWNTGINIASNMYGNLFPRMALDGSGNPLVIWGRMSDESVLFSRWTGTMFTTPVVLNPSWLTVATATWMGPDIASKGDTVYVVMKRTPETSDTNYIYIMSSFNGGVSFNAPVRVDFIADSLSSLPTVTVDDTGNPVVAFMKFNAAFGDSRWVVTKSSDYGNTFSTDVKVSGWSGAGAEICDCCPGAIVQSGNVSAMLYRDNLSNIREMWAGISTNNNTSFNSGFAVDNTNWMIMSCPASGPDGVIIGDSLYTVFMSGSGGTRTYLSKSAISGGNVNSVTNLTGSITGLNQQNFPRIATDGNAMAIVWRQIVTGVSQLPVLFTNDITNGFPAAYDTADLNDIANPDVAVSNGNLFVIWEDPVSGTVKYRKGTYTPAVTSINKIQQDGFSIFPNPTSGLINIVSPSEEKYVASIFNSLGEKIIDKILANKKSLIDLTAYSNGMYFYRISSGKRVINTGKIVKQQEHR